MADAQDSKSCGGDFVWVQVPLSAVRKTSKIKGLAIKTMIETFPLSTNFQAVVS